MIVTAYGLFWRVDEINWTPGAGRGRKFRLVGRLGQNLPGLKLADFRKQKGLYILYGNYGPHYAGLAIKQDLGTRLKQHRSDEHQDMWDRFCWFGFCRVLKGRDENKFQKLGEMAAIRAVNPRKIIKDFEALVVKSMALKNVQDSRFPKGVEWKQVKHDELDDYSARLGNAF